MNKIYVAISKIPQAYYGDEQTILSVSDDVELVKAACRDYPKNLQCYVDIEVWINGKDSGEYVDFRLDGCR